MLLIRVNYNKVYIAIEAIFIKEFLKYKQIDRKKDSEKTENKDRTTKISKKKKKQIEFEAIADFLCTTKY